MLIHRIEWCAILVLLLLSSSTAFGQSVQIADTETHHLVSTSSGNDYTIYVALPGGYARSVRRYPVIYVLDGDARFVLTTEILRPMVAEEGLDDAIVVGIGYGVQPGPEWATLRTRDLTPWRDQQFRGSGSGDAFLAFLRDELLPYVNETYRTEPDDTVLMGHSFGALLALHAMFTMPGTFASYVATSPSLFLAREMIVREEREFAEAHSDLTGDVFISVGGNESWPLSADSVERFADTLQARGYPSLTVHFFRMDGESHMSSVPGAISRALTTLF